MEIDGALLDRPHTWRIAADRFGDRLLLLAELKQQQMGMEIATGEGDHLVNRTNNGVPGILFIDSAVGVCLLGIN